MDLDRVGRLVGFGPIVAVIVIVLAGGLAIAGYGVPVGMGLLAGAALGFGVGFIVAISIPGPRQVAPLTRRSGGGWTMSGEMRSGGGRHGAAPGTGMPMHDELVANHERAAVAEQGSLVAVVEGGQRATSARGDVELIALELRAFGGIAHVAMRPDPDRLAPGPMARATVRDDRETSYEAGGFQVGGGKGGVNRYWIALLPAPPPEARRLTLTIDEFTSPFPFPPEMPVEFRPADVPGPWTFEIQLPPRDDGLAGVPARRPQ